jgi:F-type H+-transporting ATPase subunit a
VGFAIAWPLLLPMDGESHGEEYTPPSLEDFDFPGLFGTQWVTKPMLQLVISLIVILLIFIPASRKLTIVPKKWQFAIEYVYDFVRTGIARTTIGHHYEKHVPFLASIFILVLVNNWFGEFFLFMFPTFSNIGFTMGMVLMVMICYISAGIREHGLRSFRLVLLPGGVPLWLAPLVIPLEFMSNYITRPLTLTIRLFGNMFAGHLGVMVFVVGGGWLITEGKGVDFGFPDAMIKGAGFGAIVLGILVIAIELFIGFMQAYLFTLLTANYIAAAVSEGH